MGCYGRRKRLLLVVVVLSLSILNSPELLPQSSESTEEEATGGWSNGRRWENLDLQSRVMFLVGIEEGLALFKVEYERVSPEVNRLVNTPEHLLNELTISGFRFSDLVAEVSLFYEERTNIRIPVAYVYVYVMKKAHGEDPSELSSYASELRNFWNQQTSPAGGIR